MAKPADKRENLVRAATRLFHQQGFEHTSLADIAAAAGVPLGNVYYYFKTRGDFLKAVTEERVEVLRARRAAWESLPPRDRLLAYVDNFAASEEEVTAYGCPVGSLCLELNKQGGALAEESASVLREGLEWIEKQFRAMGIPKGQAQENAARLLGGRQGSVLLANTFKDPKYIRLEAARLRKWLAEMPAGKER